VPRSEITRRFRAALPRGRGDRVTLVKETPRARAAGSNPMSQFLEVIEWLDETGTERRQTGA